MIETLIGNNIWLAIVGLVIGVAVLLKSGDVTVDASKDLALKFGISPMLIGFTIVAVGTSLPEMIVAINANLAGSPSLAIGNIIGSNIANMLLFMASAVFIVPFIYDKAAIKTDALMLLLSTLFLVMLLALGYGLPSVVGWVMALILVPYLYYQYVQSKLKTDVSWKKPLFSRNDLLKDSVCILIGLIGVSIGADILVKSGISSANILGVPEALIGLTVIAAGTSLPELTTSITAAVKGEKGLAFGNIIGSNVFNILLILGLTSGVKAIPHDAINESLLSFDVWVLLGVTTIACIWMLTQSKLNRFIGSFMLLGYVAYIIALYFVYGA